MSERPAPLSPTARSLARVRLRLTVRYAAVVALILVLLGGGLYLVVRRQMARALDASLRSATTALERAARIREVERAEARGPVVDAVDELHIPDRALFLFDSAARPIKPPAADAWVIAAARAALGGASVDRDAAAGGRALRLHAERFTGTTGAVYVAAAVADRAELEGQYASLIEAFGGAALVALVLVALGGGFLARASTAPIARAMEQTRRFMADAAHELRTPVTVLRTRAELALDAPRDPARDAATLQAVAQEAGRIGAIVGDLLTLARADAGERPVARERVFLDDVAAGAVDAARALAAQRRVSVEVTSFDEAPVIGDAALLRQLVLILLDNAIKFTPAGGRVRVDVTSADGRRTVAVTDTGIGIPPAERPHVFERFWRGDAARREAEGAGLGLAIARWIADAHGAALGVTSPPDGGTRVAATFPAA